MTWDFELRLAIGIVFGEADPPSLGRITDH